MVDLHRAGVYRSGMPEERIECRTPTPGKKPTRISKTKFDRIREAIHRVVPARGDGVAFGELTGLVEGDLTPDEIAQFGSLMWYVTTVKLELEVRGELERVPGPGPQRLRRVTKRSSARHAREN
jgi:hypothetical protein